MTEPTIMLTNQRALVVLATTLTGHNRFALPRLTAITVSVGVGRAKENQKLVDAATETLRTITGQQPVTTRARRAIAGFKLRAGDVVGARVTLRGQRMWDFLNRLILLALPRIRDFHGLSRTGFDDQGNYSLGIREHTVFPEVEEESMHVSHGVGIAFTTTAKSRQEGEALFTALGLPLERKGDQ